MEYIKAVYCHLAYLTYIKKFSEPIIFWIYTRSGRDPTKVFKNSKFLHCAVLFSFLSVYGQQWDCWIIRPRGFLVPLHFLP